MTSEPTWKAQLQQTLSQLKAKRLASPPSSLQAAEHHQAGAADGLRLVIMGIGNETNGDDAAGIAAVRALLQGPLASRANVLVLDTGAAPENHTGPVRRFQPDLVLLIDAAQMDEPPGTVRWLDWTETDGLSASTHTLPPYVLARFLVADLGCALAVLGIQPAQNALGAPLSSPVQEAVNVIAHTLADVLQR